jgi:hypothetical protein
MQRPRRLRLASVSAAFRESVLFIGTQFSNLYTTVDTPFEVARIISDPA